MQRFTACGSAALAFLLAIGVPTSSGAVPQKGVIGTGTDPFSGVASAAGDHRYVALQVDRGTLVERIEIGSGEIERIRRLGRSLSVPAVAHDGSPDGLSADGSTLVLASPAYVFPQARSHFEVLATKTLRRTRTIDLDGTWTYDAISPTGRRLYLIEYTSPRDIAEYQVRVYDLRRGELDPDPVIDPDEAGEEMYGTALTRSVGPDGRWAYTLYESAERDHPPFIHALDTKRATAVCIDLEAMPTGRLDRFELAASEDGAELAVLDGSQEVASVDLETFEVDDPQTAARADAREDEPGSGKPLAWMALGGGVGLSALAILFLGRGRARRRS